MTNTPKTIVLAALLMTSLLPATGALAQSVEAKPASDASPMMVIDTPTFLEQATSSNQFEIESSELAKQKDQDATIVSLADMIIADHTAAGEKLDALLADSPNKPAAAAALSPKQEKMLAQLEAAEDDAFATLYVDIQAQAHMEAVALFRTYAGSADDQELAGFAKETLPSLENHLNHVKEVVMSQD